MTFYIAISGILGGLVNRLRGGWLYDAGFPLPKTVLKLLTALFTTCCIYLPFWLSDISKIDDVEIAWLGYRDAGYSMNDIYWFLGTWFAAFASLVSGWGSWFSIGRDEESYRHNEDWIISEWLSYLVYGKKWIPSKWSEGYEDYAPVPKDYREVKFKEDEELVKRFNYSLSPTGFIREFEWRRNMELFAMNVRGLNFTILSPLVFGLHMYYQYDLKLWTLLAVIPTGYCMGYLYEVGYRINLDKFPNWVKGSTHVGEILAGATIMSSFLMAASYLAIYFGV